MANEQGLGQEVVQGIVIGLIAVVAVVSVGAYIGVTTSHGHKKHGDKAHGEKGDQAGSETSDQSGDH